MEEGLDIVPCKGGDFEGLVIVNVPGKGKGLTSTKVFKCGQTVLSDTPLIASQTPTSSVVTLACANMRCMKHCGDHNLQLSFTLGQCPREQALGYGDQASAMWCPEGCGAVFCSHACRDCAMPAHQLLCTGQVPEDEGLGHPLMKFKMHALKCNSVFLLCGATIAAIVAGDTRLEEELKSNSSFVSPERAWWHVKLMPETMKLSQVPDHLFRDFLRADVLESARLLRAALGRSLAGGTAAGPAGTGGSQRQVLNPEHSYLWVSSSLAQSGIFTKLIKQGLR